MQSNLWSRLPIELVSHIIKLTTCQSSQDAWCLATEQSRYFHEIAMNARWHSIIIDDRDLLPAPGDDEKRFDEIEKRLEELNISQHWKPTAQLLETILPFNHPACCPANYVSQIIFDFRMLRYWTDEIQQLREDEAHQMMPSLEAAAFTLEHLKDHIRNLSHITCYGDTPQQLLEFASGYAHSLRVLLIRGLGSYGALHIHARDVPNPTIYPSLRLSLDLCPLSMLRQLVHLDIHQVSHHEAQALRISLPKLVNLQTLVVACSEVEHRMLSRCPFDLLFSSISEENQNESVMWLPSGLRRLAMIDTYEEYRRIDAPAGKQSCMAFPESLEYVNFDLAHHSLVTQALDRVNMANLQFLGVPEYYTRSTEHQGRLPLCDFVRRAGNGLERLRVVRAWDFENNYLANLQWLQDHYTIDDLVLGTRNESYYRDFVYRWKEKVPVPTLSDYLYGFFRFGSESMAGKWGGTLKRVRIDHIDVTQDLDVSILSQSSWQHLKILMLQPAPNLRNVRRCDTRLVDTAVCDELAESVVSCASQSLCVVVISAQWYWIARDTDANSPKVWSWTTAKLDALQSFKMTRAMNDKDVDFLNNNEDVPYWYERDMMEWHRELASQARIRPHKPSFEMLHQWNYLTLHRAQRA